MSVTRQQPRSEFKSVRLDVELRARLREAARLARVSESDLMREAVSRHVETILGDRLDRRISDVVGVATGGSGHSQRTGKAFATLVRQRR